LQGLGWALASSGEYMDCVSRRVERERGGINRAPNRSITMKRRVVSVSVEWVARVYPCQCGAPDSVFLYCSESSTINGSESSSASLSARVGAAHAWRSLRRTKPCNGPNHVSSLD
jgi:hypothetical protein